VDSSVNGTRVFSNTGATAYACSQAAQLAFTKMVALELAHHKARVHCICPGWSSTEIGDNTDGREAARRPVPSPKAAAPLPHATPGPVAQVSQLGLFLASDAPSHISGTEMWIDGGQSLLPGWPDAPRKTFIMKSTNVPPMTMGTDWRNITFVKVETDEGLVGV